MLEAPFVNMQGAFRIVALSSGIRVLLAVAKKIKEHLNSSSFFPGFELY